MEWFIYYIRLWMYEVQFQIRDLLLSWPGYLIAPILAFIVLVYVFPNRLKQAAEAVCVGCDRLSGWSMRAAVVFAFLIIMIQIAAVLLRYVFGLSFSWLTDSIVFAFASIFTLGAAATLRDDGHVRVDVLRGKFSPKVNAWVELAGTIFLLLPICWLVLLASMPVVSNAWAILEPFGESDGLPFKYVFLTLIPLMAGGLALQGLSHALKAILFLHGLKDFEALHHHEAGPV